MRTTRSRDFRIAAAGRILATADVKGRTCRKPALHFDGAWHTASKSAVCSEADRAVANCSMARLERA
jgi:hypothetical protein